MCSLRRKRQNPYGGWPPSWRRQRIEAFAARTYLASDFVISAHMSLLDVIGRGQAARLSKRDREFAWRAHCDFVIVRTRDLFITRVIEVNGRFHRGAGQMLRDRRKRLILQRFGIPMQVIDGAMEEARSTFRTSTWRTIILAILTLLLGAFIAPKL